MLEIKVSPQFLKATKWIKLCQEVGVSPQLQQDNEPHYLDIQNENLTLVSKSAGHLSLDFDQDKRHYQRKALRGQNEPALRCLGKHLDFSKVLDLTAGLAEDAVFFTQAGFAVQACERNPYVYLLLQDAIQRSQSVNNLQLEFSDAFDFLKSHKIDEKTAIYIDPMYPSKKKSALPRKEMQIFRQVVGADLDAEQLLQAALKTGCRRVVVKRPIEAPPLQLSPQHSFEGTTVRYDLYVGQIF